MMRFASSNRRLPLLALLLMLALPHAGHAKSAAQSFRKHYETALSLYDSGQYDGAVKEFQAAYAIKQLPRLLLNIGQAHRKLGHARDALGYYELYLRVEPNPKPEIKTELETYITQTRALLEAAERIKAKQDGDDTESEPAPGGKPATEPAARQPAVAAQPEPAPTQEPAARLTPPLVQTPAGAVADAPPSRPIYKKWSFKKYFRSDGAGCCNRGGAAGQMG